MTRSDAIVRRQILKAGLIVAGVPFCPEALFDRRAAANDERAAEDTPIGPREIIKGLDGMSWVADKRNTFAGGHNAAAVISSVFFCREQKLNADTQKEMLAYLDARLLKSPIYAAARPREAAEPEARRRSARRPRRRHRHAAWERPQHHLRGDLPEGSPGGARGRDARADRRAAEYGPEFREDEGRGRERDSDPLVGLDDQQKFVHFIFEEFLRAKGDGFDGHVVTIGHALVELHRMGHKELARKGVPAYWQWVREARAGDDEGGAKSRPPRPGRQPRSPASTGPLRPSTASATSSAATRSSTRTASTPWHGT